MAGATKSLADAGKLAQFTEGGVKFASFAERLAPGLGRVANATSFVLGLQQAGANVGNVGYAVAALGDALGALFNGIGAVVS